MRGSKAPSQRQLRVAEEIKHVLGQMFMRDETFIDGLKTPYLMITEVKISPDFSVATILIRAIGAADTKEQVALLNAHKGVFRYQLGKKIRLRIVPDIRFFEDESFEEVAHITDLINSDVVQNDVKKYRDETNDAD